jgi:hypothetical protein
MQTAVQLSAQAEAVSQAFSGLSLAHEQAAAHCERQQRKTALTSANRGLRFG